MYFLFTLITITYFYYRLFIIAHLALLVIVLFFNSSDDDLSEEDKEEAALSFPLFKKSKRKNQILRFPNTTSQSLMYPSA